MKGPLSVDVHSLTPERLRSLLNGDRTATAHLVEALAPHVRRRVTKVLRRVGFGNHRSHAPEVDDLCQDALLELFDNDARALRAWDPARGSLLPSFAQLIAERVVLSRLRHWQRSTKPATPLDDALEASAVDSVECPDRRVVTHDRLQRVLEQLEAEVSPRGVLIFRALFVEGRQLDAICEDFALRPDAVYAWRSRLSKKVRAILDDLEPISGPRHRFRATGV